METQTISPVHNSMLKRKMVGFALFSAAIMFLFMYLKLNARRQFDHPTVNSIMSGEKAVISSQHGSEAHYIVGLEHEVLRRRAVKMVQEIWLSLLTDHPSSLDVLRKPNDHHQVKTSFHNDHNLLREFLSNVTLSLLVHLDGLGRSDGMLFSRIRELDNLSKLLSQRIRVLQNPAECAKAKILLVDINILCGLGCQLHRIIFCSQLAYATGRTLLLKPRKHPFQDWWVENFEPFSVTCMEEDIREDEQIQQLDFKNFKSAARLASCPIDLLSESQRIPVSPPAVPEDIAGALHRLHGEPSAWFSGQLAHNFIRPKKSMLKHLENARKLYNFSLPTRTPIAGVHVRRTDKITTGEGKRHQLGEYMVHVDRYFDFVDEQRQLIGCRDAHMKLSAADLVHSERCPKVLRQVYLATDDPSVLSEAKRIFPHYTFYCSQERSKSGAVHQRNHKFAKMSAFIDFVLLSESDFLVCTFSSNVCRFAYELMQARHKIHGDASSLVHSLDTGYFLEPGQPNFCRMVLGDYFTGLLPGQIVDVWSTRLNSRREARRLRNKTYFSQPTYKCQPVVTAAKMSGYDEIKKKHLKLYL